MFKKNMIKSALLALLLFPMCLFSADLDTEKNLFEIDSSELIQDALLSKVYSKREEGRRKLSNTWKPSFYPSNWNATSPKFFMKSTLGFGLLRFSGVKGRLFPTDTKVVFYQKYQDTKNNTTSVKYTRTPLFEVDFGYRFMNCFKTAFSYQHQGNIEISRMEQTLSTPIDNSSYFEPSADEVAKISANLNLDAFALKTIFTFPEYIAVKQAGVTLYGALGCGLAFQSWSRIALSYENKEYGYTLQDGSYYRVFPEVFQTKDKYCTSCFFMVDLGFQIKSLKNDSPFSLSLGCKYNQWGQARNIGAPKTLGIYKQSRLSTVRLPLAIKTVYQFAPYLGLQINF